MRFVWEHLGTLNDVLRPIRQWALGLTPPTEYTHEDVHIAPRP